MKKLLILIIPLVFFFGCSDSWSEKQKTDFKTQCVVFGAPPTLSVSAKMKYCECVLNNMIERWSYQEFEKLTYEDGVDAQATIGNNCIEQIK